MFASITDMHFAVASTSGSRSSFAQKPSRLTAYLTGIGFVSMNRFFMSGKRRMWRSRASFIRPSSARRTMSDVSFGMTFDSTEIRPSPPEQTRWNAWSSLPESTAKSGRTFRTPRMSSSICAMLPDASFTATTFGISAHRITASGSMLTPVRPGTL